MTKSRNPLNLMRNEEITEKHGNPVLAWKSEKSPYFLKIVSEVRPVAYPSTKAYSSLWGPPSDEDTLERGITVTTEILLTSKYTPRRAGQSYICARSCRSNSWLKLCEKARPGVFAEFLGLF